MPRFLIGWLLGLGGTAIALVLSALIFADFDISRDGFLSALLVFAILNAILPFFVLKALLRYAGSTIALTGLVSTFLALAIADAVSDGLSISGAGTWLGSALLIWVLSMFIWVVPGPWRRFQRAKHARSGDK